MDLHQKALEVYHRLKKLYPEAKIALKFANPLQLLVATILSAQCTDERVNQVTEVLFQKYKNAKDFAEADLEELAKDIYSTGFYQRKAEYIKRACQMIIDEFGGKVPNRMEDLLKLPGVSRKTANIVLTSGFGLSEGIAVDTHVQRIAHRLGLTKNQNPEKIERDLMNLFPKETWLDLSYLIQQHGRKVCLAKKPKCEECGLKDLCDAYVSKH